MRYPDYQLGDNLTASGGQVFLTGTQALVRLMLMQRAADRAGGFDTAGFVSGYRGSPLGGVDRQMWQAKALLDRNAVSFLPAVNEELGATAVLGTQRVEIDPERTVDGVFALWYGKGPGVDRAGDAIRHGNAFGSSPHGGVLVAAGDDHGCVSSSMPHQSDFVLMAWGLPIVNPADIRDMLEFGLYGIALSRFTGAWVGLKAISETVESGSTVDLDTIRTAWPSPGGFAPPPGGLHMRWPDLPSPTIEVRVAAKLAAARHFAAVHSIDRLQAPSPEADIGIVTCGKAHLDLLETLRRLGLTVADLDAAGVRIYKVGLSFPLELGRIDRFAEGLREVFVIEEKGPVVEQQLQAHFYNRPEGRRPALIGKTDRDGRPLLSALGELRPSRVMPPLAEWLARHRPALDRRALVVDFVAPAMLSNQADGVRRGPYFCSGCPHSSSTRVPEGSVAQPGIGCHFMASWMNRSTEGLIQMGGEGVDWTSHARFTRRRHIFQNLGDGTYFHSGILAIRQAVAAGATMTYKILYNDAVAMTGGQPVDGVTSVPQIARQVEAEGVSRLAIVSDEPEKYRGREGEFPPAASFHHRCELDAVQRSLRDTPGVTLLIYDQTCAAEKRRRRRKGELPDPDRRLFINAEICEGCGDCGAQSNCLSVAPLETPLGRKRRIDQSSCNKDFTCVEGLCPSFVSVRGAKPRKATSRPEQLAALVAAAARLPSPVTALSDAPYDILVAGVGGTGVVTIGALVSMAAHLEGKAASALDFMGFAQKGGAVLCFVRMAARSELLNQARIDAQQADVILIYDKVVGASADALQSARRGRTRILYNSHDIPTDAFVRDPDATLHAGALLEKLRHAAGADRVEGCDAHGLALRLLGDTIGANLVMLGFAWQKGLVPVSLAALDRAIELNGVVVDMNRRAFAIGRLAAGDPEALNAIVAGAADSMGTVAPTLDALIADRERRLTAYQDVALARRYAALVSNARAAEVPIARAGADLPLTRAVAEQYARLLAIKDEYEVARLFAEPAFDEALRAEFDGEPGRDYRLEFHMAPLLPSWLCGKPAKSTFGPWALPAMRVLARLKGLRGTPFDPFGHTEERRAERRLADDYAAMIGRLLAVLSAANHDRAVELAHLPEKIRGFGRVKRRAIAKVAQKASAMAAELGV